MRKKTLLICDDDELIHLSLKNTLKESYHLKSAYHSDELLVILGRLHIDVLILDIQMREENEGLKVLPQIRSEYPHLSIIMMSGLDDLPTVREALTSGANDYLKKGASPDEVQIVLKRAIASTEQKKREIKKDQENRRIQKKTHSFIGKSETIEDLKRLIPKVRESHNPVLISGESGTGKEVIARQLRKNLRDGTLEPFVAVDSSTITASTAESILFGHEKGAFTGADSKKSGLFQEADGGIIYFDEISNMPLEVQMKLLRVLEEKEVIPLGSSRPIPLNFRLICATNQDLEILCEKGLFKEDLYHRLSVIPIHMPPLREHSEDIPSLITHFIQNESPSSESYTFTQPAIRTLQTYRWPGNVRELRNTISYILTLCETQEIDVPDLPPRIRDAEIKAGSSSHEEKNVRCQIPPTFDSTRQARGFYEQVTQFEKDLLTKEYQIQKDNLSRLALHLKMDRSHLYSKLKTYGIHRPKTKAESSSKRL